uniref:GDPGP1-like N-terminal domain-containing protein n=1 Tax=Ananas comosus var. bracteatus TaxID=296719 RepID=A0A6V7NXC9_ANACO|nr:unnamed protein product [Ananas comosus var. bracteatus]
MPLRVLFPLWTECWASSSSVLPVAPFPVSEALDAAPAPVPSLDAAPAPVPSLDETLDAAPAPVPSLDEMLGRRSLRGLRAIPLWASISPPGSGSSRSFSISFRRPSVLEGEKESSELLPLTVLPKDGVLIIANGNPVEYGHVCLVPYVSHQLPLFWDRKILGLVTQIAVEVNNSSFRVFLDNASTTSGHIHFQLG